MADLRLDPSDGRDVALRLPRHDMARYVEPPAPPNPYADLLDDVIRRAHADYRDKVVARAAELAEYGLGLGEVDYGVVTDPDDPNKIRYRGTFRIVPLSNEGVES